MSGYHNQQLDMVKLTRRLVKLERALLRLYSKLKRGVDISFIDDLKRHRSSPVRQPDELERHRLNAQRDSSGGGSADARYDRRRRGCGGGDAEGVDEHGIPRRRTKLNRQSGRRQRRNEALDDAAMKGDIDSFFRLGMLDLKRRLHGRQIVEEDKFLGLLTRRHVAAEIQRYFAV